ncbi:MAG: TfoX/Sxy family protein [Gemmatimonadaceae bacterium]|nr:TfoX/Sxy family protein [Gemmatimonadaceae bacterium]
MSPKAYTTYQSYALEQLGRVRPVSAKRMFGGVGVYADALFFALMDDDGLWFKVDDSNRADFEARGMAPFLPFGEAGPIMQYWRVPEEVLEDPALLRAWMDKAIAVARGARTGRSSRSGVKTASARASAKQSTRSAAKPTTARKAAAPRSPRKRPSR